MASFVDESLLSELTEHIIPKSDSIGMNEQELPNLESMWTREEVVDVSDRIAVMLDIMRTIYKKLSINRPGSRQLSRLHLHSHGSVGFGLGQYRSSSCQGKFEGSLTRVCGLTFPCREEFPYHGVRRVEE